MAVSDTNRPRYKACIAVIPRKTTSAALPGCNRLHSHALVGKERHGYDIMQQVKADSGDAVKMGPGTLYGSLDRMIEAGLVAQSNTQDPRRIYYKLTALGQTTLRAETERLSRVALLARRQLGGA
jgi:DNA-binding PadR family transcriptional regulator